MLFHLAWARHASNKLDTRRSWILPRQLIVSATQTVLPDNFSIIHLSFANCGEHRNVLPRFPFSNKGLITQLLVGLSEGNRPQAISSL